MNPWALVFLIGFAFGLPVGGVIVYVGVLLAHGKPCTPSHTIERRSRDRS